MLNIDYIRVNKENSKFKFNLIVFIRILKFKIIINIYVSNIVKLLLLIIILKKKDFLFVISLCKTRNRIKKFKIIKYSTKIIYKDKET